MRLRAQHRSTLTSLPPELHLQVLEHLLPALTRLIEAPFDAPQHYADLRHAALTMRAWQDAAGNLLHRVVVLDSYRRVRGWKRDPRWKGGTHTLIVDGLPTEVVEQVLERLEGANIRFLALKSAPGLGLMSDVLYGAGLRGVNHLVIDATFVGGKPVPDPPTVLFPHLAHLGFHTARLPEDVLEALLDEEGHKHLISFDWSQLAAGSTNDATVIRIVRGLLPHFKRLLALGLPLWADPDRGIVELCQSLQFLSVASLGMVGAENLSRSLEVLVVREESIDVDVLWRVINRQPRLRVVHIFAWHSEYSWDLEWERKEAITDACEALGIRLAVQRDQHEIEEILRNQGPRDDRHRYTTMWVLLVLLISYFAGRVP